ncbi:MAG TPA: alpha/beta hydrolase [Thermoplasmata archaeon]|nr:alpha/beta hydrolase [Thermoplasmata archaeon]
MTLERTVRMGAARSLGVREDGDPSGVPVFSLHGTPGSRLLYPPFVADARARHLRLLSYDRAGYGDSTPAPGRGIDDAAAEVRTVADALGLERFGVYGFSGGGAPALACAALLPERIVGAAVIAGVAPYPAEGLDWEAGTGEANAEDFALMRTDRPAWEAKTRQDRLDFLGWNVEQLRAGLSSLCSEADRRALTDEVAEFIRAWGVEGLRVSEAGLRDDNLSVILPWGFDLAGVRVPLQLWHGETDRFVPFAHGRWLSERLPGVDAHLLPGEGHVSTWLRAVPEVHRWLAERF